MKGFRNIGLMDRRRARAMALAHAVMQGLPRDMDPDRWRQDVHEAMLRVFLAEGVEVLSDYTRSEIGLPPRNAEGWTAQEVAAWEAKLLDAMMRPPTMPMFPLAPTAK